MNVLKSFYLFNVQCTFSVRFDFPPATFDYSGPASQQSNFFSQNQNLKISFEFHLLSGILCPFQISPFYLSQSASLYLEGTWGYESSDLSSFNSPILQLRFDLVIGFFALGLWSRFCSLTRFFFLARSVSESGRQPLRLYLEVFFDSLFQSGVRFSDSDPRWCWKEVLPICTSRKFWIIN